MLTPTLVDDAPKSPRIADGNNENTTSALPNFKKLNTRYFDSDVFSGYFDARASKVAQFIHPSRNALALIAIGDKHATRGGLQSAIEAYKNAIKIDPDMVEAYKKLIPVLLSKGKVSAASYYYSCLIDLTNKHPDYLHEYLLFRMAFFGQNSDEASVIEKDLKTLVLQNPQNSQILNTLGVFDLIYKKDKANAKKHFKAVLQLDAKNVDASNNLGIIFQHDGKYADAVKMYQKAIAVNPKHVAAYENLASVLIKQDKLTDALRTLTKAEDLRLELSREWSHNIGWLLLRTNQLEKAKSWYLKKIEKEPKNNLLINNLAVCQEGLGEDVEALKNYKKAVSLYLEHKRQDSSLEDPRAYNAFYNLMRLLQRRKNFESLETVAKKLISLDQKNAVGLYYRGSARLHLKRFMSAKESLQAALIQDEGFTAACLDLSFLLITVERDYEAAINVINKGLSNGILNDLILGNLAYAYVKAGQLSKAKSVLPKKSDIPAIIATRGMISYYEDDFEGGNKMYEEAIKLVAPSGLSESRQAWLYEQAGYWLRRSNAKKAESALEKAKAFGDKSFIYQDILLLEEEIKKKLKQPDLRHLDR